MKTRRSSHTTLHLFSRQIDHIFLVGHQISDISVETKSGDSLEQVYCLMSALARIVTDKLMSKAPRSWTKSIQVIKDRWNALAKRVEERTLAGNRSSPNSYLADRGHFVKLNLALPLLGD
jgi:hypothetical protein